MKQKIFISYARNDKEKVLSFTSLIDDSQYETWIDEKGISYGELYTSKIFDNIKQSDVFIVFLSESSVQSRWVKEEIDFAIKEKIEYGKIAILPIILEKCNVPALISHMDYLDAISSIDYALKEFKGKFGEISKTKNKIRQNNSKYDISIMLPSMVLRDKYQVDMNQKYSIGIDIEEECITVLVANRNIAWSKENFISCLDQYIVCSFKYKMLKHRISIFNNITDIVLKIKNDLKFLFVEDSISAVLSVSQEMDQHDIYKIVKLFFDEKIYIIRVIDRLTAMAICGSKYNYYDGKILAYLYQKSDFYIALFDVDIDYTDDLHDIFMGKVLSKHIRLGKTNNDESKSTYSLLREILDILHGNDTYMGNTGFIGEENGKGISLKNEIEELGGNVLPLYVQYPVAIGAALYHEKLMLANGIILTDAYPSYIDVKFGTVKDTLVKMDCIIPTMSYLIFKLPKVKDALKLEFINRTISNKESRISSIGLPSGIYENAEAIRISADIDWNKNVKLVISVEESYEE